MSIRKSNHNDDHEDMLISLNIIPIEEDESIKSQSNNGSVTPMAYSNRQSVINSVTPNMCGGAT